mmetsp:Transcript_20561/g.38616  ORF Transcript_20561/g.38616 Transcript_20561/m.38616 type:complete len:221 (-) Transcript_20561:905-1567(-)
MTFMIPMRNKLHTATHAPMLPRPIQCQPNMVSFAPLQSNKGRVRIPAMPPQPCTGKASRGSSTLSASKRKCPSSSKMPPTKPVTMAIEGSTLATPAQIATRPAKMPLHMPHISNSLPLATANRMRKTVVPPVAAARVEFMATRHAAYASPSPAIDSCDPQLKPYHPNHKMKVPSTHNSGAHGLKSSGLMKRSLRGPSRIAPVKAPTPPTRCTMPEPAKSL